MARGCVMRCSDDIADVRARGTYGACGASDLHVLATIARVARRA